MRVSFSGAHHSKIHNLIVKRRLMKRIFLAVVITFITGSLAAVVSAQSNSVKQSKDEQAIRATLDSTAVGWNDGDLSKYLAVYVKEATEMLPTGPAGGVEAIEKTMREGFWRNGKPAQTLRYESVVVRMLGKNNALVTGKYVLSGANRPDRSAWFTTVWTKTKDGWKMIHDHS
jgi:uncharacterized protein (TIGR02246 family)